MPRSRTLQTHDNLMDATASMTLAYVKRTGAQLLYMRATSC